MRLSVSRRAHKKPRARAATFCAISREQILQRPETFQTTKWNFLVFAGFDRKTNSEKACFCENTSVGGKRRTVFQQKKLGVSFQDAVNVNAIIVKEKARETSSEGKDASVRKGKTHDANLQKEKTRETHARERRWEH